MKQQGGNRASNILLQNGCLLPTDYMALYASWQNYSWSVLWEPEILHWTTCFCAWLTDTLKIPSECGSVHGITPQKTVIFTFAVVRAQNLANEANVWEFFNRLCSKDHIQVHSLDNDSLDATFLLASANDGLRMSGLVRLFFKQRQEDMSK
jgi:hypothetical protein